MDDSKIPGELKRRPNWVLWKFVERDGEKTKVPFTPKGEPARANEPKTWTTYQAVMNAYNKGGYEGLGFEFSDRDPYCGIDLDGCRDASTGLVADWAKEIIKALGGYAEVSPSGSGVKIWVMAALKSHGRKRNIIGAAKVSDKEPAIEIYDRGRYFAVTGWRIQGFELPKPAQAAVDELLAKHFPEPSAPAQTDTEFRAPASVYDRAAKYIAKMPPAISGQSGHNATFHVACVLVQAFGLEPDEAYPIMLGWNNGCQPPWSEKDLRHKLNDASKVPGQRGYLRDVPIQGWGSVKLPDYAKQAKSAGSNGGEDSNGRNDEPIDFAKRLTTAAEQLHKRLALIETGDNKLIQLGIGELDYALGGGVDFGEMVAIASRPGHGKSSLGLQFCHTWSALGMPCLFISEEMSALQLADRTLSHITRVPKEHWSTGISQLKQDIAEYEEGHAPCYIMESIGNIGMAVDLIDWAISERQVQCIVVDYVQLLRSYGKTRYEQVTHTSIELRKLATRSKAVLVVLCQLSREIESRNVFRPIMSDLKETGQLEQDADVIIGCCWPHKVDVESDPNRYQFFILKNRNRAINAAKVTARFNPPRQTFSAELPNYAVGFSDDVIAGVDFDKPAPDESPDEVPPETPAEEPVLDEATQEFLNS